MSEEAAKASLQEEQMKKLIEDILHNFTGKIQTDRATGKMPPIMSSNEWAQYVIDYMSERNNVSKNL